MDPQCFNDIPFDRNEKSDIYAIGVLLWQLTSGKLPFEPVDNYLIPFRIKNGQREKAIDGTPSEYVDLYTKCWDKDPEKRPTIESILETLNTITWETKTSPGTSADEHDGDLTPRLSPINTSRPIRASACPFPLPIRIRATARFITPPSSASPIRSTTSSPVRPAEISQVPISTARFVSTCLAIPTTWSLDRLQR